MKEQYIKEIIKLAKKSYNNNEVPVGAIVVLNNKIIGRGYNQKQNKHDVTSHAEIIAIKKASKKLKDWRLDDCKLYVTLEPCNMCLEVIKQSRIKEINYLLTSKYNNEVNRKLLTKIINTNSEEKDEYENILKEFFSKKR